MLNKALTDSWIFFKIHIVAISIIILPIIIPLEIVSALYHAFYASDEFILSEQLFPMSLSIAAYPIYSVALIFYIASIISDKPYNTNNLWKLGLHYWLPFTILSILVGLTVAMGLMLFIIPGIILTIRYAFSNFELLLNQQTPLDAMKNSWHTTKDYAWKILSGYIIITIGLYLPFYLLLSMFEEKSISYWTIHTLINIAFSVLSSLYTIFAYRIYEFSKTGI